MIVMLAGPIKHWWDCWDSPQHRRYVDWRDAVSDALVAAGHLVYRPHEAFKGQWDERAQLVNDCALANADVIVNLTPPGVPSHGTDDEVDYARRYNVTVVDYPPDFAMPYVARLERWAQKLEAAVQYKREADADLAKTCRDLLWVLDSGTPLDSSITTDIVNQARQALGVYTPPKV